MSPVAIVTLYSVSLNRSWYSLYFSLAKALRGTRYIALLCDVKESELTRAIVATNVLPEAVGAQTRSDCCLSMPALIAFSWMGVREVRLK